MDIVTDDLWIERPSVNCYYCNDLVDERNCVPADNYNNNDGGDICLACQITKPLATEEHGNEK